MSHSPRGIPASYVRFIALAVGLSIAVTLVGYWPTNRLGGPEAVRGMLAGCGVSLLASLLGAAPLVAARRGFCATVLQAVLLSTLLRFLVVIALGIATALSGWFERAPLLIWIAVSYAVLLIADTLYAVRVSASSGAQEK